MKVWFRCAHCRKVAFQESGAVNRARKIGAPLYCNRTCSGLSRRKHKSKAQKIEEKRLYDIEYRKRDPEGRKARKAAYHARTYDPVEAAKVRKRRMPYHVEYCRRPEYRAWKKGYDLQHRTKRDFGPFADAAQILLTLEREIATRASRYELDLAKGTFGKTQKRRRIYESQSIEGPKGR